MWDITGSLHDGAKRWSRYDIERLVTALERHYNAKSATGARVGIAVDHEVLFVAAIVASLRSGRIPVVLSSRAPPEGSVDCELLSRKIRDADSQLMILDVAHSAALSTQDYSVRQLDLPGTGTILVAERTATLSPHVGPEDIAIIVYTSGTTGMPKGVMLSKGTLEHLLAVNHRINDWSAEDKLLSVLPLVHVAGLFNCLSALVSQVEVFVSPSIAWPAKVVEFCICHRMTVAGVVPYYMSRLLTCEHLSELLSLRLVVSSAASLNVTDVERMIAALPELNVVNAYGLTEAYRSLVLPGNETPYRLPSIGRPVECVHAQIRHPEKDNLLEDEEEGVLWLKGPNVMLGYWRDRPRTREALADGWLCTGDIAKRRSDGNYELIGRISDVINAGGEMLSCEVIEDCLRDGCNLDEVAVVGQDDGSSRDSVTAFVVTRETMTLADLRAACSRRLHTAFWPTRIVMMAELPRGETGKINRLTLRSQ